SSTGRVTWACSARCSSWWRRRGSPERAEHGTRAGGTRTMSERESLRDRVAIVTGASSGIGAAVALAIGEAGGSVVLMARREDRLEDLAGRIEAAGGRALVRPADVTVRAEVEAVGRAAREAWGRIDILVNNAGLMPLAPLAEVRVEEWDRMIDVNLKGVLHGLGAVLPDMIERRSGHI